MKQTNKKSPNVKKINSWWRNVRKSVNVLWGEMITDTPGLAFIDGTVKDVSKMKKDYLKRKKVIPLNKKKKLNFKEFMTMKKLFHDYILSEDEIKGINKVSRAAVDKAKTGKIFFDDKKRKSGSDAELDKILRGIEDLDDYDIDDFEDLNEGDDDMEKISETLDLYKLRLKSNTHGESLKLISGIEVINRNINKLANELVYKSESCSKLDKTYYNDIVMKDNIAFMNNRIMDIVKPLTVDKRLLNGYMEHMINAIMVAKCTEAEYELQEPTEENIKELIEKLDNDLNEISTISPELADKLEEPMEDLKDKVEDVADNYKFEPAIATNTDDINDTIDQIPIAEGLWGDLLRSLKLRTAANYSYKYLEPRKKGRFIKKYRDWTMRDWFDAIVFDTTKKRKKFSEYNVYDWSQRIFELMYAPILLPLHFTGIQEYPLDLYRVQKVYDKFQKEHREKAKEIEFLSSDIAKQIKEAYDKLSNAEKAYIDKYGKPPKGSEFAKMMVNIQSTIANETSMQRANYGESLSIGINKPYVATSENFIGIGAVINTTLIAPAIICNAINKSKYQRFANKYGSNTTIYQPMIASNRLNKDIVKQLAKAMEIKTGLEIKAVLETSVSYADEGMVNHRLRRANIISPANVKAKEVRMFRSQLLDYNDVMSNFSENAMLSDINTDHLYLMNSAFHQAKLHPMNYEIAQLHEVSRGHGESGIDIESKRTALPTYLKVDIEHDAVNDITSFKRTRTKKETVIGVEIKPRALSFKDIKESLIKDKMFAIVKADKQEVSFYNKLKSVLRFWSKDKKNKSSVIVTKGPFAELVEKIRNIKTPLFHLMLEWADYVELKEAGVDLMNKEQYNHIMTVLPLISITLVNEDNGIVYMSDSQEMRYNKKNIADYIDATNELEKQLRAEVKFRHNL